VNSSRENAPIRRRVAAILGGLALLLFAASPGAADEAEAPEVAEEVVVRVAKLRIEDAEAVDEDEIREAILTTAPDWRPWREAPAFDADDLAEDLDRIALLYREHGYYDAQAESEVVWNDDRDRVRVTIRVHEGEPVRLLEWRLELAEGDELPPAEWTSLLANLPAPGTIFGVRTYRDVRQTVLARVAELGHPAARLEGGADVDPTTRTAQVAWTLHRGPDVLIGAIRVTGLSDVAEHVVRRELTLSTGLRYSPRAIRESQRRIFETGLFRSVAIQPLEREATEVEGSPTVVWPLEVRVSERSPRTFSVGVGYGTEDQFRARADWTHRNFLGNAHRLVLGGRYSSLVYGGQATLVQPYFLDRPLRAELQLSAVRETPRAYDAYRFAERLEFQRALGHGITLRFGQRFEWADVTSQREIEDDDEPPETARLHTFPVGVRHSTLDDLIRPTRGTWLDFSVEPSFEVLGSQVDYVKLVAEARGFLPVWHTTLGGRLRAGTLEPVLGSQPTGVPVFERFYAGGSTSVRGFGYQKLGPSEDDGDPLGGLSWAEGSIELRFPIWKQLSGVVFSDAGQVNLEPSDWGTNDIYYSSGAGLRLDTPVGPLRLDVARLYNPPDDRDRYAFYFSVGHAF